MRRAAGSRLAALGRAHLPLARLDVLDRLDVPTDRRTDGSTYRRPRQYRRYRQYRQYRRSLGRPCSKLFASPVTHHSRRNRAADGRGGGRARLAS
jgi:hypothetical protein